jgi:hypothetical protein
VGRVAAKPTVGLHVQEAWRSCLALPHGWCANGRSAFQDLDDDHRRTAVPADEEDGTELNRTESGEVYEACTSSLLVLASDEQSSARSLRIVGCGEGSCGTGNDDKGATGRPATFLLPENDAWHRAPFGQSKQLLSKVFVKTRLHFLKAPSDICSKKCL